MNRRTASLVIAFALAALASTPARADLPPPDGQKFVSYAFRVEGLAAFPEHVLLAFPWSLSSGRPTEEHAVVEDKKPLSVGRRSGAPKLYSMKRSDYDAWKVSYKPPSDNYEDPELKALFVSHKVRVCDAAPSVRHVLSTDDSRSEVVEVIRAVAIDDARCDLDAPAAAAEPATSPKAGGCAGCGAAGRGGYTPGAVAAALALLFGLRRGRRLTCRRGRA
jgi:hypothetical protein